MRVAVVGSGVLGAATADELARRGASVVICTAEETTAPVTDVAFGWLNAHGSAAAAAEAHRDDAAIRALDVLRRTTAAPPLSGLITWNGAVSWAETAAETHRFTTRASDAVQLVGADAWRRLLPGLRDAPPVVAFSTDDGMVEPDDLRQALLTRSRAAGAVIAHVRVDRILTRQAGGYDVLGDGTAFTVDRVVLACGTAIPELSAQLDERVEVPGSPAARFTFSAPGLRLNRVVSTPSFEIRPSARHDIVGAEDVIPGEPEAATRARVHGSLDAVREAFALSSKPELRSLHIGLRPIPPQGGVLCARLPAAPGVVALAAHPGLTLAASLARRAADLLADPGGPSGIAA